MPGIAAKRTRWCSDPSRRTSNAFGFAAGLTQEQLAERANIGRPYVQEVMPALMSLTLRVVWGSPAPSKPTNASC